MNIRPLIGWNAKVNGLRRPKAQMARFASVAVVKNGLSVGMPPSVLMRSIFPCRLLSVCEFALFPLSPTAMYSLPSGAGRK